MKGQTLMEALSYIDPKFIQEAEQIPVKKLTPWTKWMSAAACLCILLLSAFAFSQWEPAKSGEMMENCPQSTGASPMEENFQPTGASPTEAGVPPTEDATKGDFLQEEEKPGEVLSHPVTLHLLYRTKTGFAAQVLESAETLPEQIQVAMDSPACPWQADSTVTVEKGRYDPKTNTLYVEIEPN